MTSRPSPDEACARTDEIYTLVYGEELSPPTAPDDISKAEARFSTTARYVPTGNTSPTGERKLVLLHAILHGDELPDIKLRRSNERIVVRRRPGKRGGNMIIAHLQATIKLPRSNPIDAANAVYETIYRRKPGDLLTMERLHSTICALHDGMMRSPTEDANSVFLGRKVYAPIDTPIIEILAYLALRRDENPFIHCKHGKFNVWPDGTLHVKRFVFVPL